MIYSSVKCEKCSSGHFQVDNLFGAAEFSQNFFQLFIFYSLNAKKSFSFYENTPMNQCVRGIVKNCNEHASFDRCEKCNFGFFLSPKKNVFLNL